MNSAVRLHDMSTLLRHSARRLSTQSSAIDVFQSRLGRDSVVRPAVVRDGFRGYIARRPLKKDHLLFSEAAFLTSPPMDAITLEDTCAQCLSKATTAALHRCFLCTSKTARAALWFCNMGCAAALAADNHTVVCATPQLEAVVKYCMEQERKYPYMALQLFCKMLVDLRSTQSYKFSWDLFRHLCYAHVPVDGDLASLFKQEWASIHAALTARSITEQDIATLFPNPLDIYSRMLGTFYLNTFDVSGGNGDSAIAGSAVFILGSLFNHSCDPNVEVRYRHKVMAAFHGIEAGQRLIADFYTLKDVDADSELRLSYVNNGHVATGANTGLQKQRQRSLLKFAYGFDCNCGYCTNTKDDMS